MAKYTVSLTKKASKQLDKLPALVAIQIIKSIESLGSNPRPNGCKKLRGREGYRIRIGTYRVIYTIFDKILLVEIIDVGHRREIYQ
jgi:mRNA interferase RelE/StbE